MAEAASVHDPAGADTVSRAAEVSSDASPADASDDADPVTVPARPGGARPTAPTGKPVLGLAASSPASPKVAPVPAPRPAAAPARARRGGGVLGVLCALLSLAGAAVALAAPVLRPLAFDATRAWLGDENPIVASLAAPPAGGMALPVTAGPALPEAALAALRAELAASLRQELDGLRGAVADQGARVQAVTAALPGLQADAARNAAAVEAGVRAGQASAQALDALRDRLDRMEAQAATLDTRLRAAGLLAVAGQFRRDIDVGAPLRDDLMVLAASRLPAPVERALAPLARAERGVATQRDLGIGFEALDAVIAARGYGAASWVGLGGWFGGNADRAALDELRGLAVAGRFSEAADGLERSQWAGLAQRWVAQVRLRSAAVRAAQLAMAQAIAGYEAGQALADPLPVQATR